MGKYEQKKTRGLWVVANPYPFRLGGAWSKTLVEEEKTRIEGIAATWGASLRRRGPLCDQKVSGWGR